MYSSDLGSSLFLEDIFFWDIFHKQEKVDIGHFFLLKRVKRLKSYHHSLLIDWLDFANQQIS
jgi:hypothetical protein